MDQDKKMSNFDYNMLSFILSGRVRMKVFASLSRKPNYAYALAKENDLNVSYVLRVLKDLEENNVVKCLNPTSKRRKFYTLTSGALRVKERVLNSITQEYCKNNASERG